MLSEKLQYEKELAIEEFYNFGSVDEDILNEIKLLLCLEKVLIRV
ncbi:MAG: hypothetical protein ACRC1M_08575 [Methanobacteriaceae archaeon]